MAAPHPAGRAASVWQMILGAVLFLMGTCVGAVALMPEDLWTEMMHQQPASFSQLGNNSLHAIRLIAMASSGILFFLGVLLLILAIFVRREAKAAIITSIVVTTLFGSLMLTNFLTSLPQLGNPAFILPLFMLFSLLALCIMTILKLVAAMRSGGAAQAQAMQQAYWWMMQQQQGQQGQGGYGQAGYGYGYGQPPAPPAAPPPPPPPPPPQNPPPSGSSDGV
jgi:hypothetical protein